MAISYPDRAQVCLRVKRDLFVWQKRPICMAKETYSYGKRDLFCAKYCLLNVITVIMISMITNFCSYTFDCNVSIIIFILMFNWHGFCFHCNYRFHFYCVNYTVDFNVPLTYGFRFHCSTPNNDNNNLIINFILMFHWHMVFVFIAVHLIMIITI